MIGARLGKWTVDKELGRGGMGQVYLAHDDTGQQFAVKVLAPELAMEAGFQQRFLREIAALSQLEHPNIVRFYEAGQQEQVLFYVMEYVAGNNFDEILEKQGRLPWKEVLNVALQIAPALKHAHDRGVIHRDIKPQNLLRSQEGVVKLTDFGIAKVFAADNLTATGGIVGTAEYLSPEQAAGKPVTKRSDLYSLGTVLYHLLTGSPPFEGETTLDLLHKHRYGQFDRPQRIVPDVPHELDELVCQLLEKDPAKRPADGLVLLRQVQRIMQKYERKSYRTDSDFGEAQTLAEHAQAVGGRPGPATLMSKLMREELQRQKQSSAFAQAFNTPWVLGPLFVLVTGVLVWALFFRSSDQPEELLEQATALAASEDPADRDKARGYLERLQYRHPTFQPDEVERQLQLLDDEQTLKNALRGLRRTAPVSEAERFYRRGLNLCRQGDVAAARAVWQGVVRGFEEVEAERRWVALAQKGLQALDKHLPIERDEPSVQAALEKARQLHQAGKQTQAETIWRSLEDLYRGEPAGQAVLDQIERDRRPP